METDSSPRVWRKLSGVSVRFSVRLTHPRLCRENAIRQAVTASYQDSSLCVEKHGVLGGLERGCMSTHPCVWRNMAAHIAIADSIDSSPYMQGKRKVEPGECRSYRLIPTCVEKTTLATRAAFIASRPIPTCAGKTGPALGVRPGTRLIPYA